MANKMGYNLIADTKEYSRYYGNFRGVDFSSDHTQVADTRFSYLVNMYKDYRNGQGGGVETFPGFRKILNNSIGEIKLLRIGNSGNRKSIFVYTGLPDNDGNKQIFYMEAEGNSTPVGTGSTTTSALTCFEYLESAYILSHSKEYPERDSLLTIWIDENSNQIHYGAVPGVSTYIPTTYKEIPVPLTEEPKKYENEQRNLLCPWVKNTFIASGANAKYYPLSNSYRVVQVTFGGNYVVPETEYSVGTIGSSVEYIQFNQDSSYAPSEGDIVEITLEITNSTDELAAAASKILGCTIVSAYDNRIFLSGNPSYPNYIFWCGIPDDDSGIPDPTYWGELNYVRDGVGSSPIMGMFPVADTLCVLKADTIQDGVVYYHSPSIQEGNNVTPITYPSVRGLSGQGLISRNGCANFRDDPVYISAQGLDAIGQLSVRYERATEHRSSLVDAKLLQSDLSQAKLTVWNGYLILYTNDGKAFLADSRATYGNGDHNEYEWYYLEDLGAYEDQADAVRYAQIPSGLLNADGKLIYGGNEIVEAASDMIGSIAGAVSTGGDITDCTVGDFHFAYKAVSETIGETEVTTYYYCEYTDYVLEYVVDDTTVTTTVREKTGGTFKPATAFLADGEDLYMATEIGLFKFNFDLRNSDGSFYPYKDGVLIYARNDRAFGSGCATKMDNCGIPHLVKTTAKKSLVIKTRSEYPATMKVKVRTNRNTYNQIARLSDDNIDFERLDFADLHFTDTATSLFAVSEKEKKWVEKQYYIYNDEFNKNFCLFYIAYRYSVSGRYKNK